MPFAGVTAHGSPGGPLQFDRLEAVVATTFDVKPLVKRTLLMTPTRILMKDSSVAREPGPGHALLASEEKNHIENGEDGNKNFQNE